MDQQLVDRIYECAFVPEQWPDTLDTLSRMTAGAGGSLYVFGKDATMLTASPDARERAKAALAGGFAQRGHGLSRVLASSRAGLTGMPEASRYMTPVAAATAMLERSSQRHRPSVCTRAAALA